MSVLVNEKIDINTAGAGSDIDSSELAQRIAILRRFRTLLTQQRDRFRSYLEVLDKQQDTIESGSAEDLLSYVEMEEKIVADIFSIQKVIDPLEEMYRSVISGFGPGVAPSRDTLTSEGADEVPSLKAALEDLKNQAVIRSTKNKELLSRRMVELRSEIKALRNNPFMANSRQTTFNDEKTASMIDIQG
ncbi:MAG: flagellar biosynthesis protein FlgN [Treponema sp.]|nr:flagellar biosynthesis protein FlgN [Treponema sp.]